MYGPSGHTIVVSASFVKTTLNDNSWATISQVSAAGTAQNYWNVGDVKYITLNGQIGDKLQLSSQTFGVFILGFDHNASVEGYGISFGTFKSTSGVDICLRDVGDDGSLSSTNGTKYFNMNHWGNYNYGGWKASDIRYDIIGSTNIAPQNYGRAKTKNVVGYDATTACTTSPVSNTLMAALPADLKAVMKPITKYTDNVGNYSYSSDYVTTSVDYLPLLAEYEVHGVDTYANESEQNYQKQYQYYINGNSKKKYNHNTTSLSYWLLRSPRIGYSGQFCTVSEDGNSSGCEAGSLMYGLAATFLI